MSAYISEVHYEGGGGDFIEVVVPAGTDTSGYTLVIYDTDGTVESVLSFGAVDVTTGGNDGYVIDESDPGFVDLRDNSAIALVDNNGNVIQFLGFKTAVTAVEGPANGQTSDTTGDISTTSTSVQTYDRGASYSDGPTNPGTIPCYVPGTMIGTPDGPRAVETLRPGDLVTTVDNGPQQIRWVRSGDHPLGGTDVEGKPVLIQAGALGKGLPAQDLIVSPQHRILVGGAGQLARYFDSEVYAPAKALTGLPGIRHMRGKAAVTYIHFACDRHEVVTANGCLSETLLLGPVVVAGLTRTERRELARALGIVAAHNEEWNGPAARTCLTGQAVRIHLARLATSKRSASANDHTKWGVETDQLRSPQSINSKHRSDPYTHPA